MASEVGEMRGLLVVDFFFLGGGRLFSCKEEEGEIGKGRVNG